MHKLDFLLPFPLPCKDTENYFCPHESIFPISSVWILELKASRPGTLLVLKAMFFEEPHLKKCVLSSHAFLGTAKLFFKRFCSSDVPSLSFPIFFFCTNNRLHCIWRVSLIYKGKNKPIMLLFCSFCQATFASPFSQMFILGLPPEVFCFVFCTII